MLEQINHYAIRGGVKGRERLRMLARAMHASTTALFDRLDIGAGLRCLDAGCGGGDVTLELARRVGPHGRVVGVDIDKTKLGLASHEAAAQDLRNVEFRALDVRAVPAGKDFDVIYVRFLLSHLADPAGVLAGLGHQLRPGGLIIVEDIDLAGAFVYPETPAFQRYREFYSAVVRRRGGDPTIGPRLPSLLVEQGFEQIDLSAVQPLAMQGEVKLLTPLTLENIADSILDDRLATRHEIDALTQELYVFAADPRTIVGLPRIVQAWGRRPA